MLTCMFPQSFCQDLCRHRTCPGKKTKVFVFIICQTDILIHYQIHCQATVCHFIYFSSHLKKLDSNAGEHEVKEHGDQYNVSNGLDSNKYTLDHMLQRPKYYKLMMNQAIFKTGIIFLEISYL